MDGYKMKRKIDYFYFDYVNIVKYYFRVMKIKSNSILKMLAQKNKLTVIFVRL